MIWQFPFLNEFKFPAFFKSIERRQENWRFEQQMFQLILTFLCEPFLGKLKLVSGLNGKRMFSMLVTAHGEK
jgi:hypothetical protein